MDFTLNISTHPADLAIIEHDWVNAQQLLVDEGFTGYEMYPVGEYSWERIPPGMIRGLHLRFFPIITPFWRNDHRRLLDIFGNKETIARFYGAHTPEALIDNYRTQLNLAHQLGCTYVVFHLAQSELDHIYDWQFPWEWRDTVTICAEILQAMFADSPFAGELLLENLWWPGSFRALHAEEIAYVLKRITHPRAAIMLDTGHLLNTNQQIASEQEGIRYLLDTVRSLGEMRGTIRGVHLTKSLSAGYVMQSQSATPPAAPPDSFWKQYFEAIDHVRKIDQHDAFEDTAIADLFDLINPATVTYEFTFASRREWLDKIRWQHRSMERVHRNCKKV
jgi:hypothetical protein